MNVQRMRQAAQETFDELLASKRSGTLEVAMHRSIGRLAALETHEAVGAALYMADGMGDMAADKNLGIALMQIVKGVPKWNRSDLRKAVKALNRGLVGKKWTAQMLQEQCQAINDELTRATNGTSQYDYTQVLEDPN